MSSMNSMSGIRKVSRIGSGMRLRNELVVRPRLKEIGLVRGQRLIGMIGGSCVRTEARIKARGRRDVRLVVRKIRDGMRERRDGMRKRILKCRRRKVLTGMIGVLRVRKQSWRMISNRSDTIESGVD